MAEEFQGGVCEGNWWTSSRNFFGSSPCSLAGSAVGSFGWHRPDLTIMNTKHRRPSDNDSAGSASDMGGGGSSCSMLRMPVDSAVSSMMGISAFPSPTALHGWNPDLLHGGGRSDDQNFPDILQEPTAMNMMSYQQQSKVNTETCQGLSAGVFPLNSTSYTSASSLLQTFFDTDQPEGQALLDNEAINYSNYPANSTEFLAGLPEVISPMENPMFAKQHFAHHLPVSNNALLWSTTAASLMSDARGNYLSSTQPQNLPSPLNNSNNHNFPISNIKRQSEAARSISSVAKKACIESAPKRPRIETPSPLPTFKVRKEKLGDRITALQQLVSPFGKTDTASVLHEAIEYIKFLHDQVSALCTPYLKKGSPQVLQPQQGSDDKLNDQQEQTTDDLRSGGLCLVPVSSTFPVADAATDFWNPSFGGSFKL